MNTLIVHSHWPLCYILVNIHLYFNEIYYKCDNQCAFLLLNDVMSYELAIHGKKLMFKIVHGIFQGKKLMFRIAQGIFKQVFVRDSFL